MSKLPDIIEPERLASLIRGKPAEIIHNNEFRALVIANVRKMPETTREELMHLMQVTTMNQNG